jgi:hopanoid biosynthesis associated RND transporter like protein HpnN
LVPPSGSDTGSLAHPGHAYVRFLRALVERSRRSAWAVLAAALLATGGASYIAATHISINTNTSLVLFHNLPFTRVDRELEQAFPQLRDRILILVDGDTPGLADKAAERLAKRLPQAAAIGDVYQPGGGRFFRENGLLYLDTQQLDKLTSSLIDAEPLVASIARDPSLRGLFALLVQALEPRAGQAAELGALKPLLRQLALTVEAYDEGRFYQLPWSDLMGAGGELQGKRRLIMVTPRAGGNSLAAGAAAVDAVNAAVDALGLNVENGVNVRLTGSVVLNQAQLKAVTTGARWSLALSLGLVVLFLALGLRSLRMILATLLVLLMGLVWTVAFAVAVVGPFNLISVSFAVLFIGLGVDFGIQFCVRYYEELGRARLPREAMARTATGMGPALSLAAAAAGLSFYSVLPTDYAGIIDLGIISGTSMFIGLFANLTVLPALLAILRVRRGRGRLQEPVRLGFLPVRRFAWSIVGIAGILGALSVPLLPYISFDFNLTKLQNPKAPAVIAFRELERGRFSPLPIEALEPDLAAAEQVATRLRKLPSVFRALTLQSYVPDDQAAKLALLQQTSLLVPPSALDPETVAPPPDAQALAHALDRFQEVLKRAANAHADSGLEPELRRLQEALAQFRRQHDESHGALMDLQRRVIGGLPIELADLAAGLQAAPVTLESLPDSLRNQYITPDGRARIEVFAKYPLDDRAQLVDFVTSVQDVLPNAAGTPVLFVQGGRVIVSAFIEASLLSLVLITVLLSATLRRVGDVLLILSTLILSGLMTMGAMVLLGIEFNIANIIVLPLLIGLGVAFGIYFVQRRRGGLNVDAIMHSSTPSGVLFSGLVTLSSFGSLSISPDPGMATLGRTLVLALAIVLANVLLVLSALMALTARRQVKRRAPEKPMRRGRAR